MAKQTRESRQKKIQRHYNTAVKLAMEEVERLARLAMSQDPVLEEFIMGMGTFGFAERLYPKQTIYHDDPKKHPAIKPLWDFIEEWDRYMCLTGNAMRFTATGPVVREW